MEVAKKLVLIVWSWYKREQCHIHIQVLSSPFWASTRPLCQSSQGTCALETCSRCPWKIEQWTRLSIPMKRESDRHISVWVIGARKILEWLRKERSWCATWRDQESKDVRTSQKRGSSTDKRGERMLILDFTSCWLYAWEIMLKDGKILPIVSSTSKKHGSYPMNKPLCMLVMPIALV